MNGFFIVIIILLVAVIVYGLLGNFPQSKSAQKTIEAKDREIADLKQHLNVSLEEKEQQITQLKQQCARLRNELEDRSLQAQDDLKQEFFTQLQTLLANYPTATKMAQQKPDLPAKNLVALFTPITNLLSDWGYETIGIPWQKVTYNPQLHQADSDDIQEGEMVYIRFIGYRRNEQISSPAKVSKTLPPGITEG